MAGKPSGLRLFRNLNAKIAAVPMVLTTLVVFVGGTLWTVLYSFTNSKLLPRLEFVGLDQYKRLWATDLWNAAIWNLAFYGVMSLIFTMTMGFVLAVLKIPLTDFGRGEPGQPPLEAGGVAWAVAICYEDIFGEELIDQLPRAGILLNVSNDAWFGESLAADQHLQFSQMRSLETGRWMVRSTNTGVTAAIDERGRVVARLPAFVRGTLEASPVPRAGSTPYVRWGNAAALMAAALAIGLPAIRRRRPERREGAPGR